MVDKKKFLEEDAAGYAIHVLGRGLHVTQPMKDYAWEKMSKAERFGMRIMHVQIVLDIHRLEHVCDIIVKLEHFPLKVQASSSDMYASIDKAIDRLQAQLRRWKGKIEDHSKKKLSEIDVVVNVLHRRYDELEEINADIERVNQQNEGNLAPHRTVGKETFSLSVMNEEDALMRLDLSREHFLIYRDEKDMKLKVLYRRHDGHYGLIEPE